MGKINVVFNPLAFPEIDEPWASALSEPVTYESFLRYLCKPGISSQIDDLIARYKSISTTTINVHIAPAQEQILEKLIYPLRDAKASYMVGNFLGTISLCGMVAEMVAILYFEIADISINQKHLDDEIQKHIFGSNFEKLGQDKRAKILQGFNIIDEETSHNFDVIRDIRRKYLHFYSKDHSDLARDSFIAFEAAIQLVNKLIGANLVDNGLTLQFSSKFLDYLRRIGFIE